jgi:hypothetical protein
MATAVGYFAQYAHAVIMAEKACVLAARFNGQLCRSRRLERYVRQAKWRRAATDYLLEAPCCPISDSQCKMLTQEYVDNVPGSLRLIEFVLCRMQPTPADRRQ